MIIAKYMELANIEFYYALTHKSESYLPILIGIVIFYLWVIGLVFSKLTIPNLKNKKVKFLTIPYHKLQWRFSNANQTK